MIAFEIEGKPQAWQRAGVFKGRHYTKRETRDWKAAVSLAAKLAMGRVQPLGGPVSLSVQFFHEVPKSWSAQKRKAALASLVWPTGRPDCSNLVKSIEDACNGILFGDDAQIVRLEVFKIYGAGWSTVIRCAPIPPGDTAIE